MILLKRYLKKMSSIIFTNLCLSNSLPVITLGAHQGYLIALDWHTQKTTKLLNKLSAQSQFIDSAHLLDTTEQNARVLSTTITQLKEYFDGQRQVFDVPINISMGTPFQQKVWQALRQIPYGQTISYAKLASKIDNPNAFRACANANGKNPISLIIPCHRVIASDGSLGGYTGGLDIKQTLLAIEKADNKL